MSGDHGGQSPLLPMQSVKKSSMKAVLLFTVCYFPYVAETSDSVHSFQVEQRIECKDLDNFLQYMSLQRTVVPQFIFETPHTKHQSL